MINEKTTSHSPDHEAFIQSAKEHFGHRGKKETEALLERASALFAGGDLDERVLIKL